MIISAELITNFEINTLEDLYKLQSLEEGAKMKVNKSQLARELGVDRRTVDKYMRGYKKPTTRISVNCIDHFDKIIRELLLEQTTQIFYYKRILWQYLVDNHDYKGSYGNFCKYIKEKNEFDKYFKKRRASNTDGVTVRFETDAGKQAQLDWKESIEFILSDGEVIKVNVFVLLLSYSRFRVYRLSISKSQDVLFQFLDDAFETFGGIPQEIVTDNMKTVMNVSRTKYFAGQVNTAFQQFADDYGFKVKPCLAGRPNTKAKVEAPMKILDEIRAYSGKLNYAELNDLVIKINNRVNAQVCQGSGRIPISFLTKEKDFLNPLPHKKIRKSYWMTDHKVKVNHSSMFNYQKCQYSVPPKYIGKTLRLQIYDNRIHAYYNTELVTIHDISSKKLNYLETHYLEIAKKSNVFKEDSIQQITKENLKRIGEMYSYE